MPVKLKHLWSAAARSFSACNVRSGKLDGRVAIVTGGTKGKGFSIAKRLAEDGARVVVSSRRQHNVDIAVKELEKLGHQVFGVSCNIAKPDDRKELLTQTESKFGGIDILVQNAGVNTRGWGILKTQESDIKKASATYSKANCDLVQDIQPYMVMRKAQSSIVLVSSTVACNAQLFPGIGIYAIFNASVIELVKALMPDLLRSNIRINCVTIGGLETQFTAPSKAGEKYKQLWLSTVARNRIGKLSECDGMVSLLCSDDARCVTGENFVVAEGQYARF